MPRDGRPSSGAAAEPQAKGTAAEPKPTGGDKQTQAQRILKEVWGLYRDPASVNPALGETGLEEMSRQARMNPQLLHPRRRVTVMIIGALGWHAAETAAYGC
jgi:hypothetical protein